MKIWLITFLIVVFGLSVGYGQPLDPGMPGSPPLIDRPELGEATGPGEPSELPGPPGHRMEGRKRRRSKKREFRERIKAVKAELDLLRREIGVCTRKLKELRGELSASGEESEEARIKAEIRDVVERLSQYEILLSERKAEISKKAFERASDRYIKAQVELEEARKRSRRRLKRLEKRAKEEKPPAGPGKPGEEENTGASVSDL